MDPDGVFIPFGAQYYRAPTPHPEHWEGDLDAFRDAGFNTLKYWAQWRWNHPKPDTFQFDDLDRLMDLAAERDLRVIINAIFDCAPAWIFRQEDDCRMLTADGRRVGPVVNACRQIGGVPGPCLNHPGAREHRLAFLEATVRRYAKHPALYLWDTWNEPEFTCCICREPRIENQVCYCEHCVAGFKTWLEERFGSLDAVNARWGRNYPSFEELEVPVNPSTYTAMIDWRMFQVGTITGEQRRRVAVVRAHDSSHVAMCHTVPMPTFNPVTCGSDEWELAEHGDWVGNSLGSDPFAADLIRSAGNGRVAINSEIHAIPGSSLSRPRPLDLAGCKPHIFLPLAHGIKGFIFWQYRPEALGVESPAWGLTRPDGSATPWLGHFAEISRALQADRDFYWNAQPDGPEVGLLYHPANHIFCWCAQGSFDMHDRAVRGAYQALYEANFRVRFLHPLDFVHGRLDGLRAIVYPFPYVLDDATAEALRAWVRGGGTLVGEAFFGNLNVDTSLHTPVTPGHGFDAVFGAREGIGTPFSAAANLYAGERGVDVSGYGPTLCTDADLPGLPSGHAVTGYLTRTPLDCQGAEAVARFDDGSLALTRHAYGDGQAFLCGTLLTVAAHQQPAARRLLAALAAAGEPGARPDAHGAPLRIDMLRHGGEAALIVQNLSPDPVSAAIGVPGLPANAVFEEVVSGARHAGPLSLAGGAVELYRVRVSP